MEAATFQKKKFSTNKGKLKKTIKNIICRPDPILWPEISEEQGNIIEALLSKHKVHIPQFKKPHWKELKSLPKEQRPKTPKIEKVIGLLFGISECSTAIQIRDCCSVIIESTVNPQTIMHPVIEACMIAKVPVICLNGLRKCCANNFGIPTSCLGIKTNYLQDISSKIVELAKDKLPQERMLPEICNVDIEMPEETKSGIAMDTQASSLHSLYLYRSNKKSRAFVPPSEGNATETTREFIGQDFIEFPDKPDNRSSKKAYLKMSVKRITNNPKRVKAK